MRRALAVTLGAALMLMAADASAAERVLLGLRVHVVHLEGSAVVPPAFVAERVARANEIFAPYGVAFAVTGEQTLAARYARLEVRADRDALGAETSASGSIDCFVVEALRDVDEPERMRRGVHWRSRSHRGKHFVIVSSIAGLNVLAHELGHFLGNPEHSQTAGNLMSYEHTAALPFLDAAQQVRLQRALRGYLRRGELRPVTH